MRRPVVIASLGVIFLTCLFGIFKEQVAMLKAEPIHPTTVRTMLSASSRAAGGNLEVQPSEVVVEETIESWPAPTTLTPKPKRVVSSAKSKKVDYSILGIVPDDNGINRYTTHCFNVSHRPDCVAKGTPQWLKDNVLVSVITGKESSFRVELSNCTWLRHFPWEVLFVVTDVSPFPHRPWVTASLPSEYPAGKGGGPSRQLPRKGTLETYVGPARRMMADHAR